MTRTDLPKLEDPKGSTGSRLTVASSLEQLSYIQDLDNSFDKKLKEHFHTPRQDQVKDPQILVAETQKESGTHNELEQTAQVINSSPTTMSHRISGTVTIEMSDLFWKAPNTSGWNHAFGICEYIQFQQLAKFKVLDKQRKAPATPLELKYALPWYFSHVTLSMNEEQALQKMVLSVVQVALIGVLYENVEMKIQI